MATPKPNGVMAYKPILMELIIYGKAYGRRTIKILTVYKDGGLSVV